MPAHAVKHGTTLLAFEQQGDAGGADHDQVVTMWQFECAHVALEKLQACTDTRRQVLQALVHQIQHGLRQFDAVHLSALFGQADPDASRAARQIENTATARGNKAAKWAISRPISWL